MNHWRRPAALGAVLLLLLTASGITFTPSIAAAGIGQFTKVSDTYYRDPLCDGNDPFIVDLWVDAGYQGIRYRFCSAYTDLCWVPFGSDSSSATLCDTIGLDAGTANDHASSIKVVAVNGGSTCRVKVYEHKDYGGVAWTTYDPLNDSDLGPVWPNDTFSSIKRVC